MVKKLRDTRPRAKWKIDAPCIIVLSQSKKAAAVTSGGGAPAWSPFAYPGPVTSGWFSPPQPHPDRLPSPYHPARGACHESIGRGLAQQVGLTQSTSVGGAAVRDAAGSLGSRSG